MLGSRLWLWVGLISIGLNIITISLLYAQLITRHRTASLLQFQIEISSPEFRKNRYSALIVRLAPLVKRDFYGLFFMLLAMANLGWMVILTWLIGTASVLIVFLMT
jgi:hypothetical protein